ncbi:MAG: MopE-related protein [Myxococcota bacterium]
MAKAAAASDASCDGKDNDCDGKTDEEYAPTETTCGAGSCAAKGLLICKAGVATNTCAPATGAASDATCNGVDDDCDGQTDEDYVSTATSCGVGACARSGASSCVGGVVQANCAPEASPRRATPPATARTTTATADRRGLACYQLRIGVRGVGATSCVAGKVSDSCVGQPAASDDLRRQGRQLQRQTERATFPRYQLRDRGLRGVG